MYYMLMTFTKPNKCLNVNPINSWTVILIYVQISILNPISRLYSWVLPRDKYQKPLRVGVMLRNATHCTISKHGQWQNHPHKSRDSLLTVCLLWKIEINAHPLFKMKFLNCLIGLYDWNAFRSHCHLFYYSL